MKGITYTLLMLTGLLGSITAYGKTSSPEADSIPFDERLNITSDCESYDSIIASWRESNRFGAFDNYASLYINVDTSTYYIEAVTPYTDAQYQERLRSIVSPVHLPYNSIVRKHLVAYVTSRQAITKWMIGQSLYYFPIIEQELEKAGLPLELKFMAVVESALQPTAVSPAGAVGLWQFMLTTGRYYGLEISSMVDERRDPVASTRAACAYLKDLYDIYGDWTLALASYNFGPGNVNKALKRAGGTASTYWDIYPYLPKATRDYIPAFVGLTYAYHYYKDHHVKPNPPTLPIATDTVTISRNLHLQQVATTLEIPLELLQNLNPQYKQDIIPAATRTYPLVLPQREISRFLEHEQEIYAKDSLYLDTHLSLAGSTKQPQPAAPKTVTYKVRKGDTLGAIASKYGVSVSQLIKRNRIKSANRLQIGQTLQIVKP